MSTINVNAIDKESGSTLTLGGSGTTVDIPSGTTLDIASGATLDTTGATETMTELTKSLESNETT